jgi:SAM-dependent methyltransferase
VDQGRFDRFFAPVADALHRGAAAQAARALSEAGKEHGAALEIWNRVMPDGEDAGHPVFHLVNPFFYLWAGANLRFDTQAAWQSEEAIVTSQAAGRMLESYPFWRARQDRALIAMRAFIAGFATPPRVLDLACGQGEWLQFMAESCGVPLENLHGVELHAARLTGANDLLREHFACDHSAEDLAAKLERNLEVGDLLELSAEDIHTRHGTIDVITMAAVTPVFDDQKLARFLALLAQIRLTYIVVVTQIKHWDLNHGRADEDAWFARHGFEVERQEWAVLPLHPGEPHMTYLPQKYWPNRRITIYRAAT